MTAAPTAAEKTGAGEQSQHQRDPAVPVPGRRASGLTVSVIICAYTEQRWHDLSRAVDSALRQSRPPAEVFLVIDHNEDLLARAKRDLTGARIVPNTGTRGLSGARNTGVALATGDVIAFLDDDAAAEEDWLEQLAKGYRDPRVLGVGGRVEPAWAAGRPSYLPEEFDWVVGCSYRGLPTAAAPVRNLIGANMSFRRDVLTEAGAFSTRLGRVGALPLGCEETELCIRAKRKHPDGHFWYTPSARVAHHVPAARGRWAYFRSRCYSEGVSKAMVARLVGANSGLESERTYVTRTLPQGFGRGLAELVLHRDRGGLARSAAIVAGLTFTAAGYARGAVTGASQPEIPRQREVPSIQQGGRPKEMAGTEGPDASSVATDPHRSEVKSSAWDEFDLHGRIGMRVAADAPTAGQLRDMFGAFRTTELARADLTVTGEKEPMIEPAYGDLDYTYTPTSVHLVASDVQVVTDGKGFRVAGSRELLTTVLPLVDRAMVQTGAAMIHAATCDFRGSGVALPAWGGVGKTSTIAKLMKLEGVGFMGDDWAFLAEDGQLLGYAKPMFIKPHHRPIYPHLFERRRKPLIPSRFSEPVAKLTTLVHPAVTKYPRLANVSRRWSPEHMMVTPAQALPHAAVSSAAPLVAAIFLERYEGPEVRLREQDRDWMVTRMVGNFHAEMSRHSRDVLTAMGAAGLLPLEQHFSEKARVLHAALSDRPTLLLQVPRAMSADEASDRIVEQVLGVLGELGLN